VRQAPPQGQVLAVVDVEGSQQQDVGGAHANKVQPNPAPTPPAPPSTPGGATEGGGGNRQGAKDQQVGVLRPAQSGQPGRGGDHHPQRPVVEGSQAGVGAGALGLSAATAPVTTQVSAAAICRASSRWKVVEPAGISPAACPWPARWKDTSDMIRY
jgi:hypothetical protein